MLTRRRPGVIRDAIVNSLRSRANEATVNEIVQMVSEDFEDPVSPSSVRSYLQLNTPGTFERTKRGAYRLVGEGIEERTAASPPQDAGFRHGGIVLYQGNCIDWLLNQQSNTVHAVVTDPPYGLVEYSESEQNKLRAGHGGVWRIPPSFDGHRRSPLPRFTILDASQKEALRVFFRNWAAALIPVLVPGAHVFVASNPLLSHIVSHSLAQMGLERRGEIIRLVMTMRGGDRPKNAHHEFSGVSVMPRSMWEPWLLFRKPIEGRVQDNLRKWGTGGLRRPSSERPFGDVIKSAPTPQKERRIAPHPSVKPQAFLRRMVHASLPLGKGVVLDPFAGSGSTLAACNYCGYEGIGIELDSKYLEVAKKAIPLLGTLSTD